MTCHQSDPHRWVSVCLALLLISPPMAQLLAAEKPAAEVPPMPKAVSSFGAITAGGYVYIYGGHQGKTHHYDTETALGTFHRWKLDGGTRWEELPGGPKAQGLNLAADARAIYRIGGMQPQNAPGQDADNLSLNTCAQYDLATGKWLDLPKLPQGRSSHDVVVVGQKLIVVGGWEMKGKNTKPLWHDTILTLDLTDKAAKWESNPQPFQRRALTAVASGGKVYVLGGMGVDGADRRVDIYDVQTNKWSTGPELPGADHVGFSPAATIHDGRVVVYTSNGNLHRLSANEKDWEKLAVAKSKRMVARLLPHTKDSVILLGGTSGGENRAEVEVIRW